MFMERDRKWEFALLLTDRQPFVPDHVKHAGPLVTTWCACKEWAMGNSACIVQCVVDVKRILFDALSNFL